MKISSLAKGTLVPALYLSAIIGLILFIINRDLPKVGHDYGFFIPRMLDTYLHYKVNGLAIQWYTANFGAGIPAYPNPQYIQYSLPQFYMFAINPWLALMASLVTYALLGFAGFYLFLRDEMGWLQTASLLGASFILANGFFVEHAIVGHVGFQHFPLLGLLLFLAFTRRLGSLPAGILMGLVFALLVNQAGFVVLVILAFSLLILFPLLYLIRPALFQRKLWVNLLTGGAAAALLSLSKISAVIAFMRFFPRVIEDDYGQTYLQGLIGMLRQLTGFDFSVPYFLLAGGKMTGIADFFHQGAGAQFGLWEMNMALSPALLLLLILGLGYGIFAVVKYRPPISGKKVIAVFILLLGIWMATDMTLAQGWLYALLKPLPILRSLHANVRFTAAFIFPLAILGSLIFNMLFKDHKRGNVIAFSLSAIFTLAMLSLYLALPLDMHVRNFNLKSALPVYARIDNGWNFTLQNVAEITDMEVFHQEDSNLGSQDPMFGYEGEFFHPKAVVGPIMEVHNGTYNMTNPASYVFPEENDLQPFDLFREDQGAQLERFIKHQQPGLKLSSWQIFADIVSFVTLVGSVLYLILASIRAGRRAWQMNAR